MTTIRKQLLLTAAILGVAFSAHSQNTSELDKFIQEAVIKPYDCPEDEFISKVKQFLDLPNLTKLQRRQLRVRHTHWQICVGQHEEAKQRLQTLLSETEKLPASEDLAYASYQLGFIYDLQENEKRCDLYQQTQKMAEGKYSDLYLSASMGLITVCNTGNDEGVKLAKMYALLEPYAEANDNAALAHIHNNIGLYYASLGQHVLAAEQYQKSYELGFDSYTGSNQLATLISVISSHMASANFDQAWQSIEEFKRVNLKVDTALSNVWLHFAEAGYHYRTGNMPGLRDSLAKWRVYLDEIDSTMYNGLYRWYSAVPCLEEKDKVCLQQFLQAEENASEGYKAFLSGNKDYLKFMVEIQLLLGDIDQAKLMFSKFSDVMFQKVTEQQASGKILGVANLHSQINSLESSLEASKSNRVKQIWAIASALVLILVLAIYFVRKKYLDSLSYDPVTGLLNAHTVLNQIRQVPAPSNGHINALALFDLGNFRDVNSQIGATSSDIVLQQIAMALSKVTRERDILGRFAPEQFIVCLTDTEENSAKSFFERMRYALENTFVTEQQNQNVSVRSSTSIFISSDAFHDLDEILNEMQLSLVRQTDS
ncbi:diguanylate cyclase domain-containing protein [Aliiglaciecola litoralis]|uniref:diguanylate cyclase domain-containing protein n=1 Tax=Aliiglaciecola litoralis TaxID=582857 RepID=UPI0031CE3AED